MYLIDYINQTDSIVTLKFYSNQYKYTIVSEVDSVIQNKLYYKQSKAVKSNQQFYEVTVLPHQTVHAFLCGKPISFKEYFHFNPIELFRYTNPSLFPELDSNTYKKNIGFNILYLLLLGMTGIMLIFYALAFGYLKDKIYLSYTLYLFSAFLQVAYMYQYIFSKNMQMINIYGNSGFDEATKGLMIIFYCFFYIQIFNITNKNKFLFYAVHLLKWISVCYVLIIILSYFFESSWYFEPDLYVWYRAPIFTIGLTLCLLTLQLKNKNGYQKIILMGSFIYLTFALVSIFQSDFFPFKNLLISINTFYLGVSVELIFFSFALALKMRATFKESEIVKDNLIDELKKKEEFIKSENNVLEIKVRERVAEIKKQNILIEEQKRNALIHQFEKEKMEIQMQALSAQMNPHFIFNCMNAIQKSIVTNEIEKASLLLTDFASLIRMVLQNSTQPTISLSNEIELLEQYLKLEQNRLSDSFEYQINIDENLSFDFIEIPNMMLQPLLENAIWHGFRNISYKGKIIITFSKDDNLIRCIILDNGIGRVKAATYISKTNPKVSHATNLIQNRIDMLNYAPTNSIGHFEIVDLYDEMQQPIGTKAIIDLPIQE
jgi:sensor histidine kinase YesM